MKSYLNKHYESSCLKDNKDVTGSNQINSNSNSNSNAINNQNNQINSKDEEEQTIGLDLSNKTDCIKRKNKKRQVQSIQESSTDSCSVSTKLMKLEDENLMENKSCVNIAAALASVATGNSTNNLLAKLGASLSTNENLNCNLNNSLTTVTTGNEIEQTSTDNSTAPANYTQLLNNSSTSFTASTKFAEGKITDYLLKEYSKQQAAAANNLQQQNQRCLSNNMVITPASW